MEALGPMEADTGTARPLAGSSPSGLAGTPKKDEGQESWELPPGTALGAGLREP